jgi:hypothetical protein
MSNIEGKKKLQHSSFNIGYSIFNPSTLCTLRYAPFDKPFDKLMVLSEVEGLIVLSIAEGVTSIP